MSVEVDAIPVSAYPSAYEKTHVFPETPDEQIRPAEWYSPGRCMTPNLLKWVIGSLMSLVAFGMFVGLIVVLATAPASKVRCRA
jgi:hypothetical protein